MTKFATSHRTRRARHRDRRRHRTRRARAVPANCAASGDREASICSRDRPTRVKRDEVMHLSRQLGAFVRAGLPLIEAVHTLGEEAKNPTLRADDGRHRGRPAPRRAACRTAWTGTRGSFPAYYRGILRSAELTGQLDTVLDQLAKYLERDLEARRKIKPALIYPAMIAAMSRVHRRRAGRCSCCPGSRRSSTSLDAELPLPTRILLAVTDFFTEWWWAVLGGVVALVAARARSALQTQGRPVRCGTGSLLRLPVIGDDRPVRAGRAVLPDARLDGRAPASPLPEALRVATESLRNRVFIRSLAQVSEAMLRGRGPGRPAVAHRAVPGHRRPDDPGRRGDRHARRPSSRSPPATTRASSTTSSRSSPRSSSRPSSSSMGLVVGFVAVALVSAMYGIFSQVESRMGPGRRPRDDRGETLIELLVAVMIMGIAVVAVVGGARHHHHDVGHPPQAGQGRRVRAGVRRGGRERSSPARRRLRPAPLRPTTTAVPIRQRRRGVRPPDRRSRVLVRSTVWRRPARHRTVACSGCRCG